MCLKFLVAARRQREMMVIIANAENEKSAEWQDEDNLDISEIIPEKKVALIVECQFTPQLNIYPLHGKMHEAK